MFVDIQKRSSAKMEVKFSQKFRDLKVFSGKKFAATKLKGCQQAFFADFSY